MPEVGGGESSIRREDGRIPKEGRIGVPAARGSARGSERSGEPANGGKGRGRDVEVDRGGDGKGK